MKKIKSNPAQTLLVITVGFIVLYVFSSWKWTIYVALGIGLIGVFSPFLSKQIETVWMKLAYVLSLIVPNILLTIVFYLLLFPIALLSRMFGEKDPLQLKNNKKSLFKDRKTQFNKAYFEKMW